jgi:hypothetical protein
MSSRGGSEQPVRAQSVECSAPEPAADVQLAGSLRERAPAWCHTVARSWRAECARAALTMHIIRICFAASSSAFFRPLKKSVSCSVLSKPRVTRSRIAALWSHSCSAKWVWLDSADSPLDAASDVSSCRHSHSR